MNRRLFIGVAVLFLGGMAGLQAASRLVASPDHAETWPWARLEESTWRLDGRTGALTLVLTYSNERLADRTDPRQTEDLWFEFPAARYDEAAGSYLLRDGKGRPLTVARRARGFVKTTALDPHVYAIVSRDGAEVRAALVIDSSGSHAGRALVEVDRPGAFTLQRLVDPALR